MSLPSHLHPEARGTCSGCKSAYVTPVSPKPHSAKVPDGPADRASPALGLLLLPAHHSPATLPSCRSPSSVLSQALLTSSNLGLQARPPCTFTRFVTRVSRQPPGRRIPDPPLRAASRLRGGRAVLVPTPDLTDPGPRPCPWGRMRGTAVSGEGTVAVSRTQQPGEGAKETWEVVSV